VSREVTIAAAPNSSNPEALDLGTRELTLTSAKPLKVLSIGDLAPDFRLTTLDGKPLSLKSYRGKYVLLDFWATWCAPCRQELPHLKELHKKFGTDKRFELVSLSLDNERTAPRDFAKKEGIPWVQGFLGKTVDSAVTADYGVTGIPAIFLIGPDGRIVAKDLRGTAAAEAVATALTARSQ
jgi:thiol-disulfide isomerase/thioredoxin